MGARGGGEGWGLASKLGLRFGRGLGELLPPIEMPAALHAFDHEPCRRRIEACEG